MDDMFFRCLEKLEEEKKKKGKTKQCTHRSMSASVQSQTTRAVRDDSAAQPRPEPAPGVRPAPVSVTASVASVFPSCCGVLPSSCASPSTPSSASRRSTPACTECSAAVCGTGPSAAHRLHVQPHVEPLHFFFFFFFFFFDELGVVQVRRPQVGRELLYLLVFEIAEC
jgi:hypothetical protein